MRINRPTYKEIFAATLLQQASCAPGGRQKCSSKSTLVDPEEGLHPAAARLVCCRQEHWCRRHHDCRAEKILGTKLLAQSCWHKTAGTKLLAQLLQAQYCRHRISAKDFRKRFPQKICAAAELIRSLRQLRLPITRDVKNIYLISRSLKLLNDYTKRKCYWIMFISSSSTDIGRIRRPAGIIFSTKRKN